MSLYCNPDDLEKQISKSALIQLTNDNPDQEEIDTVICGEAILYSSTLIDGYLMGKYTLPLNSQFPLLRIIAIDKVSWICSGCVAILTKSTKSSSSL